MAAPAKVGFHGKPGKPAPLVLTDEQVKGPLLRGPISGRAPLDRPSNGKGSEMPVNWALAIRAILARTGWPTDTLARKLGVSGATVRNWFAGRFIPSKKVDQAIVCLYRKHVGEDLP